MSEYKENMDNEVKLYELGYNLVPTVKESDLDLEVQKIKSFLSNHKSEIIKEGAPKLMDLEYPMVKHLSGSNQSFKQAYFGWIKFNSNSEAIEIIKKDLETIESILRFLLIKTVDDDEHSTAKILVEEVKKDKKEEEDEDERSKESEREENKPELIESPESDVDKEVDEAIEEIIK